MSKSLKKVSTILNYFNFVVSGFVAIFVFVSLVGILISIASSTEGLKVCVITE